MTPEPWREVSVVSPAPRDTWQKLFESDPAAVLSQSPAWADCVARRPGWRDASRLYTVGGRQLVLPLAGRDIAGVRVEEHSWPYGWGYGGLLAEGGRIHPADVEVVVRDLARRRLARASVTPMPLRAASWDCPQVSGVLTVPYQSGIVDLSGGYDAVWRRFDGSVRNARRRAERMGVEVHRDVTGSFAPQLSLLYAASVERWARDRGQPVRLARGLARLRNRVNHAASLMVALGESCPAWMATWRGEVVAIRVAAVHGNYAHGLIAATDIALARHTRAAMALDAVILERVCAEGTRWFLLGESDAGGSVARYKRQFGAFEVRHSSVLMERLPAHWLASRSRSIAERALARRATPAHRVSR